MKTQYVSYYTVLFNTASTLHLNCHDIMELSCSIAGNHMLCNIVTYN